MALPAAARARWSFRPAEEADIDGLTALHQRVFGRTISRDQWTWKLRGQPGPVPGVWVAEADGRLVFQYAGIPTRFRHRAAECLAMVDVDTMTHPDYRRRGLLTQGASFTYEQWKKAGISFTLGLPNEQWGSRTAALGWVNLGELRWWIRWLDPLGLLAAKAGLRGPRGDGAPRAPRAAPPAAKEARSAGLEFSLIEDPAPFDALWSRMAEEGVVRDAAWFRWRYLDAVPKWNVLGAWKRQELVGAAAFHVDAIRDRPSGLVGEVVAPTFDVMKPLLRRTCAELRALGALRVAVLIQPGSMFEEAALATGFLPHRWTFSVEAVDLGGGLPRASRFQGGDFDVV